jgi:hypothetical protein
MLLLVVAYTGICLAIGFAVQRLYAGSDHLVITILGVLLPIFIGIVPVVIIAKRIQMR